MISRKIRGYAKIGDVFVVKVDDKSKKYFQYIISDLTQLNSDVIRAFKKYIQLMKSMNCHK